ncbi:MAG: hypothetical protein RLZZ540_1868 [Bacteroidota bacterium]|jgi:hypothetical protein
MLEKNNKGFEKSKPLSFYNNLMYDNQKKINSVNFDCAALELRPNKKAN